MKEKLYYQFEFDAEMHEMDGAFQELSEMFKGKWNGQKKVKFTGYVRMEDAHAGTTGEGLGQVSRPA